MIHSVLMYVLYVRLLFQSQGFEYMRKVATSTSKRARHLLRAAQYNVARAYFQGYGVRQSDEEAEKLVILLVFSTQTFICLYYIFMFFSIR